MKKITLIAALAVLFTGCQRSCTKMERDFQPTERNYEVTLFSGGDTVFTDHFKGIINNSTSSDGIYYYKDNMLVEISGDYVVYSYQ